MAIFNSYVKITRGYMDLPRFGQQMVEKHVSPWEKPWHSSNGSVAKWSDHHGEKTLWWTYKKLWKMAIEIVDFPINSMVDLSIVMLVYQRVPPNIQMLTVEFPQHQSQLGIFQCRSKWSKCETKIAMIQLHLVKSNIGNAEGKSPNLDQSNCVFSARKSCPMF